MASPHENVLETSASREEPSEVRFGEAWRAACNGL
jgi:hypothetical protein